MNLYLLKKEIMEKGQGIINTMALQVFTYKALVSKPRDGAKYNMTNIR